MISHLPRLEFNKGTVVKLFYIILFISLTTTLIAMNRKHHQNNDIINELNILSSSDPIYQNEAQEITSIKAFELTAEEVDALGFIDSSLNHSLEESPLLSKQLKLDYEVTVLHSNLREQKLLIKLKPPLSLSGKNLNLLLETLKSPLNLNNDPAKLEFLTITNAYKHESSNLYNINFSFSCTRRFARD